MTKPFTNPDFNLLASAGEYIRGDLERIYPSWQGSRFEWILKLPPGTKGRFGKYLINQWCALKGLSVDRSPDSDADILINGHRVEVKFSTIWETCVYKFQQIRDQNYEYSVCLGISPFEAHCWVISKVILRKYVIGHLGQHTGSTGQETSWITVNPNDPPYWLTPCGGTLERAFSVLNSLSPRR